MRSETLILVARLHEVPCLRKEAVLGLANPFGGPKTLPVDKTNPYYAPRTDETDRQRQQANKAYKVRGVAEKAGRKAYDQYGWLGRHTSPTAVGRDVTAAGDVCLPSQPYWS